MLPFRADTYLTLFNSEPLPTNAFAAVSLHMNSHERNVVDRREDRGPGSSPSPPPLAPSFKNCKAADLPTFFCAMQ